MKNKRDLKLTSTGGLKAGTVLIPKAKSQFLKQGGGLEAKGGMEGVQIEDAEFDDMFFESVKTAKGGKP
jgi:hypothetical protein